MDHFLHYIYIYIYSSSGFLNHNNFILFYIWFLGKVWYQSINISSNEKFSCHYNLCCHYCLQNVQLPECNRGRFLILIRCCQAKKITMFYIKLCFKNTFILTVRIRIEKKRIHTVSQSCIQKDQTLKLVRKLILRTHNIFKRKYSIYLWMGISVR